MHQVSRHGEMLYEMDTKMFIMNKTIQDIMLSIDFLQYESDVLDYFQARTFITLCPQRGCGLFI